MRQHRKGSTLLIVFAALLICFWPLRLLRFFVGMGVLGSAWLLLSLYAGCSAYLSQRRGTSSRWWLVVVVGVALLSLLTLGRSTTWLAGFYRFGIPGSAMEPTILHGDQVIADTYYYRNSTPQRRDVLIFHKNGDFFARRVIALGGETIEGRDGVVLVNHQILDEPYVQHIGSPPKDLDNFGPLTVPAGEYFVLGDNRDISRDSRLPEFGPMDRSSIAGKTLYTFRLRPPGSKNIR